MNFGGYGGRTYSTLYFLFIIKKTQKVQEYDLYLNRILHNFDLTNLSPRMNNKYFTKRLPQGAPLLFLYDVSIVVLIDLIAILLTPGIFLIQIVNTNNTNVHLIHFHSIIYYTMKMN